MWLPVVEALVDLAGCIHLRELFVRRPCLAGLGLAPVPPHVDVLYRRRVLLQFMRHLCKLKLMKTLSPVCNFTQRSFRLYHLLYIFKVNPSSLITHDPFFNITPFFFALVRCLLRSSSSRFAVTSLKWIMHLLCCYMFNKFQVSLFMCSTLLSNFVSNNGIPDINSSFEVSGLLRVKHTFLKPDTGICLKSNKKCLRLTS